MVVRLHASGRRLATLTLFRNLGDGAGSSSDVVDEAKGLGQNLCANCARWAFSRWRGWAGVPRPDPIPDVPELVPLGGDQSECRRCGGAEGIEPESISYDSYSSPGCTGLPDYLFLKIMPESAEPTRAVHRLGLPYVDGKVGRCSLESLSGHRTLVEEWYEDQKSLVQRRDAAAERVWEVNRSAELRRTLRAENAELHRKEKIRRDAVFHERSRSSGKVESADEVRAKRAARKERQAMARMAKQEHVSGR